VFILDIGLPDMDGYELARRLQADPRTAKARFMALTGYGQAHDKVLSAAAGFDHHFLKPIDTAMLNKVLLQRKTEKNNRCQVQPGEGCDAGELPQFPRQQPTRV